MGAQGPLLLLLLRLSVHVVGVCEHVGCQLEEMCLEVMDRGLHVDGTEKA